MGFDNECILNIQSLAGEYFCPVCRLLVYPNEALQSQCTHLYCKPCLAYVVSTTRACPYDGYLVTEADSKPLTESNKALAEIIGKTLVHCLYHRSGCPWQGPLSDCNSHCASCAFGSSPVVCNRCAIQIVHRDVQEHAQSCPGAQPQSQPVEGGQDVSTTNAAAPSANTEQTQASKLAVAPSSQPQPSQAVVAPAAGQDPSQQANANPQVQPVASATAPTPEQWYQQYYQQYPGYDPYQNYYPYQQPIQPYQQYPVTVQGQQPQVYSQAPPQAHANFQSQAQVHSQPQAYPAQSQPQAPVAVHVPAVAQPSINPQHQLHAVQPHAPTMSQVVPHAQPYAQAQPQAHHPPVQPQAQQHIQMPQYQQPQPQIQHSQSQIHSRPPQPQSHMQAQPPTQNQPQSLPRPQLPPPPQLNQTQAPNPQSQIQNPSSHGVSGHQAYPPQSHQQMQLGSQHPPNMHLQSGPTPQYPGQMQGQFPPPPQMRPPQSQGIVPNQQQPYPSHGLALSVSSAQQSIHPHAQQPGLQRPVMQPVQQQSAPQQYVQNQQPYPGQSSGTHGHFIQQQNMQPMLRPQGPPQSMPQNSQAYMVPQQNVPPTHGLPPPPIQNFAARQGMPNQVVQTQHFPQSPAGFASVSQARPMQPGINQPQVNQSYPVGNSGQLQPSSEKQTVQSGQTTNHRVLEKPEGSIKKEPNSLVTASGVGADGVQERNIRSGADLKSMDGDVVNNSKGVLLGKDTDSGMPPDSAVKHKSEKDKMQDSPGCNAVEIVKTGAEAAADLLKRGERSAADGKLPKDAIDSADKDSHSSREKFLTQSAQGPGADDLKSFPSQGQEPGKNYMHHAAFPPRDHVMNQHTPMGYGPAYHEQRPAGAQPAFPPGPPNHAHAPGQHPNNLRPQGPGGIQGPGVASFGRPPNQFGPGERGSETVPVAPPGYYNQGPPMGSFNSLGGIAGRAAPHGPEGNVGRQFPPIHSIESDIMLGQRSHHLDGRQHDAHFDGSSERAPFGQPPGAESNMMRMNGPPGDMRFKHGMDEGQHRFPMEPGRRVDRGELEEDLKQFPRHSNLDNDPAEKFDSFFSSAKPTDRRPHGELGASGGPRFLPPFHHGGSVDAGNRLRPVGPDGNIARADATHPHPDFLGPVRGFGRHNMDRFPPRSPGREYFGGPGQSGPHDIDGRESRPFGEGSRSFNFSSDQFGSSFEESRFPPSSGHLRRGELDGPGNMRPGELVGSDIPPNQLRRGDFMGPRNISGHMPFGGEPAGFGGFPGHPRSGDLSGPGNFQRSLPYGEPFGNKSGHPRLGEPGFRSSYSLAGGLDPFDNSRKRKATSMGWCRICKVDCETVEGLDMHSQTREHQKMAMDMVISIKQQNKKQKTSKEHPSLEDPSKLRGSSYEVRGSKP